MTQGQANHTRFTLNTSSLLSLQLFILDVIRHCYPVRAIRTILSAINRLGIPYHSTEDIRGYVDQNTIQRYMTTTCVTSNPFILLYKWCMGRGEREKVASVSISNHVPIHTQAPPLYPFYKLGMEQ